MIRLHEFITKIRNCKTIAEERAEYQKEMAAIRESFAKNEQTLRPRNVTKLLFINMSGQETNFGQMECLKLITANSLIEKRIGYLGLTQLFHEKSELLMMATNRLRVDLNCMNNNIVSLTLCVLSEICTTELSKELHNDVLKCISNNSAYIRKKAILTGIKVIKKSPEYISEFMPKISTCLEEKSHGVLLACLAFLENVLQLDESFVGQLVELVPKIARAYRLVAQEHNAEYEISGVQDPFLQVSILKFLRNLRKFSNNFDKQLAEILIISHDTVCSRVSGNIKNGANAVLFECFQCFMLLEPTSQLKDMVSNVLTKFISVKDANSKYLSLFNLNLMTKYDIKVVKNQKSTIFECLTQNDILIRVMALDLLLVITSPDNVNSIVKDLLNTLLAANDEDFISELAQKICLIVEKHSQSRRWHFDTILKVLILADQSVKQESAKSLVHLVTSTNQLQQYCMAKLFFSTCENIQNDALCKITLYLIGELAEILFRIKGAGITEANILDLIESIIFKAGINNDTIAYGLSALLKLYQKFTGGKDRIEKMIRSFENHSDLQVQKRACEYSKLLESIWDQDRKKQICIPVPVFKLTAQNFKGIPVGETDLDLDLKSLKLPEKLQINYDSYIPKQKTEGEVWRPQPQPIHGGKPIQQIVEPVPAPVPEPPKPTPIKNLMDDDDLFGSSSQTVNTQPIVNPPQPIKKQIPNILDGGFNQINFGGNIQSQPQPQPTNIDPFNILGLDMGGSQPIKKENDFLLGFNPSPQVTQPNNNANNLLGGDFLGFGSSPQVIQPQPNNNLGGFNFNPVPAVSQPNFGFSFNTDPVVTQPHIAVNQPVNNPNKFLAYDNQHLQIWMNCVKDSQDTTTINTTYINKTQSVVSQIAIQAAVLKHIKLTINPLSSTTMQPLSKEQVNQTMTVVNSMVGQKGVVMKMKLSYAIAGQKFNFEEKIQNFPANV